MYIKYDHQYTQDINDNIPVRCQILWVNVIY